MSGSCSSPWNPCSPRVPTAQGNQGKWHTTFPVRENQGNLGNLPRHRENQGTLCAQVVNYLILKICDIAIVANEFFEVSLTHEIVTNLNLHRENFHLDREIRGKRLEICKYRVECGSFPCSSLLTYTLGSPAVCVGRNIAISGHNKKGMWYTAIHTNIHLSAALLSWWAHIYSTHPLAFFSRSHITNPHMAQYPTELKIDSSNSFPRI